MDVGDGVGDGLVGGFDRGVEQCRGRNGVNVTCRSPDPDRIALDVERAVLGRYARLTRLQWERAQTEF
jgi:hypothetical protein